MGFVADLHIHSRFSRATSKELNPINLHRWSALKGLGVVGTGDFTHPEWNAELKDHLEPAEEGLYKLKPTYLDPLLPELPEACRNPVRFMLTVEISLIYKKNDKTRKVHHVVMMPDFDAVDRLNKRLDAIGNIKSDGRPILGLDSRDLLEICVEASEDVLFVPAHIWTPHFAVLGASSGFDTLDECFEDMLPHIFAVETGLSSDPAMNWRLSMLDRYAIISNSDAHSAPKLAREATCFGGEMSFPGIYDALKTRDPEHFLGTLEFYPEEGKYHYDGHRKCDVCWKPTETIAADGVCPVCGKKLTVGVLHRVEKLADREEGGAPDLVRPFTSLITLTEVIGSVLGVGPNSKKVRTVYDRLLGRLGPELEILREISVDTIADAGEPLIAEGIRRMRDGEVDLQPGYDGVYGVVQVFNEAERQALKGQESLFEVPPKAERKTDPVSAVDAQTAAGEAFERTEEALAEAPKLPVEELVHDALDTEQLKAVKATTGPVVVSAGPGTGKTRVLTHRIADLVQNRGVLPGAVLAVTFTNKAAQEMRDRIGNMLSATADVEQMMIGTFHAVALHLLKTYQSGKVPELIDDAASLRLVKDVMAEVGAIGSAAKMLEIISMIKSSSTEGVVSLDCDTAARVFDGYQERLRKYELMDFDDVLLHACWLLTESPETLSKFRNRFQHILVDEFQDTNPVQYEMVRLMAGDGDGLFVIGDPNQSIYGFRGASPECFGRLSEEYETVQSVSLATTYRSTHEIVEASAASIAQPSLQSPRGPGVQPRHIQVETPTSEGITIAKEIRRVVGGTDMLSAHEMTDDTERLSFGDIAVLFRTGRQADVIERCLERDGIPVRVAGQKDFLEDRQCQSCLTFLRFVHQPTAFGLRQLLREKAFRPTKALLERLERNPQLEEIRPLVTSVPELNAAFEDFAIQVLTDSPSAVVASWIERFGEGESFEKLLGVADLADDMGRFLYQSMLSVGNRVERKGETLKTGEAVSLMTVHASKGLEFPVVFLAGVEDGLMPMEREDSDREEEKRLLYVGMTRARDELILTSSKSRVIQGERVSSRPSMFLEGIPEELLSREVGVTRRAIKEEQLSLF
jgi:uncharacterized protein (TIGR00375 family)